MKLIYHYFLPIFLLFLGIQSNLNAQTVLKGKVIDGATKTGLFQATVQIKGTTEGIAVETDDGSFELPTTQKFPLTVLFSYAGYKSQEIVVNSASQVLDITLSADAQVLEIVTVTATTNAVAAEAPVAKVEINKATLINSTGADVVTTQITNSGGDVSTGSLGNVSYNFRGFAASGNTRILVLVDAVDNQSPGLNFSLGTFLGSSELDLNSLDLVVGAASAYYGPNAFNGVVSTKTRNPFIQNGIGVQLKYGERNLMNGDLRIAEAFKNKKGKDFVAFKINGSVLEADDWRAENYSPLTTSRVPADNPGRYDAVNIYGDEYAIDFDFSKSNSIPAIGNFYRSGYKESDVLDYKTKNYKLNGALHFRLDPDKAENSPELIIASNYSKGTTVYQGDNRFRLKNIEFYQNRIEIKKQGKYFLRAYATNEDAGDSYDPYFTALQLVRFSKNNAGYSADYRRQWLRRYEQRIYDMGYPEIPGAERDQWLKDNRDSLVRWHEEVRQIVEETGTVNGRPFLQPGTEAFNTEFNRLISTASSRKTGSDAGTKFVDRSALYHAHGEYRFQPQENNKNAFFKEITIGANTRLYRPNSQGSIFSDTLLKTRRTDDTTRFDTSRIKITNFEYGIYGGVEKEFKDKNNGLYKIFATFRLDKNQNFNYLASPAISGIYSKGDHVIRLGFSSAIRNPTLTDQYLSLNVGPAILSGNVTGQDSLITIQSFLDFLDNNRDPRFLKYFSIDRIRPEQVRSIDAGYQFNINKNTSINTSFYYNFYKDFIGFVIGIRSKFDPQINLPVDTRIFRYSANASETVTSQGATFGLTHKFQNKYKATFNYSYNQLNSASDDPIIPAFNTPKNKFNVSLSGTGIDIPLEFFGEGDNRTSRSIRNVNFGIDYRYVEGFTYEGSPQFTGFINSYQLVDVQLGFKSEKNHLLFKVGASNILNNQHYEVYGGPLIGRLGYVQLTYDFDRGKDRIKDMK